MHEEEWEEKFFETCIDLYNSFHPFQTVAFTDEAYLGDKRESFGKKGIPEYFDYFWILGPEITEKHDLTEIPETFETKKLEDGGILIREKGQAPEEAKEKLYNLPKKK